MPKCRGALDRLDEDVVLGDGMGYSHIKAWDVAPLYEWRGRRIHLLGASLLNQYRVILDLTQPNLRGDPPADITGLDWNGMQKVAYFGEYWTPEGWISADHLSIRNTVRWSLEEVKAFWQEVSVWPETTLIDLYGPAVLNPDDPLYVGNAGDITSRDQLEDSLALTTVTGPGPTGLRRNGRSSSTAKD